MLDGGGAWFGQPGNPAAIQHCTVEPDGLFSGCHEVTPGGVVLRAPTEFLRAGEHLYIVDPNLGIARCTVEGSSLTACTTAPLPGLRPLSMTRVTLR